MPVRHETFAGMLHPFFTLGGVIADTARLEDLVASAVQSCVPEVAPQSKA